MEKESSPRLYIPNAPRNYDAQHAKSMDQQALQLLTVDLSDSSTSVLLTSAGPFVLRSVKHRWHELAHQAERQQGCVVGGVSVS